jgi:hypothetical protein
MATSTTGISLFDAGRDAAEWWCVMEHPTIGSLSLRVVDGDNKWTPPGFEMEVRGARVVLDEAEAMALALWLIRACKWTSIPMPERG